MASRKYEIGRFDYVEPVNPNLDKSDTEMINKPEDYCISVNLEVKIPSRFYEEEPTYLNASSDNGTVSFFGGVDTGNNNSEPASGEKGFLSTSWTDISVNTTDKGNKDSIGIESINISYSPTFFPVVTIKFVDVRGASLFMPQEKAYEIYTNSSDMGKKPFQSSSFFKSLFSIPSPIFKLTVKGFYGQAVSYKLMMSKSDFDFDSQNGNFIANVQFAGYMYGVYTELPMSYVALAPYIDNLAYWNERNFTFDNGVKIPTIAELITNIADITKTAEKESSQSIVGKDLNKAEKIYELLNQFKANFPFNSFNFYKKSNEGKDVFYNFVGSSEPILSGKNVKEINSDKNTGYQMPIPTEHSLFFIDDNGKIKTCREIINELVKLDSSLGSIYKQDFEEMLQDVGYNKKIYFQRGVSTHCSMPVYCYGEYKNNGYSFYNVNTTNFDKNGKYVSDDKEGDLITRLNFYSNTKINVIEISDLVKRITDSDLNNLKYKSFSIWKIETNILNYFDRDIKDYDKKISELKNEVTKVKSEIAGSLLGFNLSIENVYKMIFAHIDTFMHHYYNVLKETNEDSDRRKVICDNKSSVCDVPDKILSERRVPPYPTFVKSEDGKKIIAWPYEILKQDIPETRFVERIINASIQANVDINEALRILDEGSSDEKTDLKLNMIPTNAIDFLNNFENPYNGVDTADKIWYIFALRFYYFMYMYRFNKDEKINNINEICKYFAICEAVNIKKALGKNISQNLHTKLLSSSASAFTNIVKKEGIYNINGSKKILNYLHAIKKDTSSGEEYAIVPVDKFEKGDILKHKHIELRTNGELMQNPNLNKDAIKIIDDIYTFEKRAPLITSDSDFSVIGSDVDSVVDYMFKNYFGERIKYYNSYGGKDLLPPYKYINSEVKFTDDGNLKTYNEVFNSYLSYVSLKEDNKNFTSYINGYACIDTINVLAGGTKMNHNHFVNGSANAGAMDFLDTSLTTDFDIAYYFLWSLPISKEYSKIASKCNFKRMTKTVLLREGAQYYWEDNFRVMKSHIRKGYGQNLTKDSVPIINEKTGNILNSYYPTTLYMSNVSEHDYQTWDMYVDNGRKLSITRRNYLKEYFIKWVNEEFSTLRENFESFDANSEECKKNGLSDGLMSSIIDLYLKEVILADYSSPITCNGNGTEISSTFNSGNAEKSYKKAYTELGKAIEGIYKIEDSETPIVKSSNFTSNSSDDVKLSVYLTLQTIYNKFVAGNKINRWTLGDKDSDFNNFLYLDTYYKEIGQSLYFNGKNLVDNFRTITADITALVNDKDGSNRNSVYNFLSNMCAKNGINLIAMPINPYIFTTQGSSKYGQPVAWDLFDTIPYTQMETKDTSCFVSLYTYRPSLHLDIQDDNHLYCYENDGFDINKNGEKDLPVALKNFSEYDGTNIRIPSFAVTYAKQNQSIFKNINVSTSNFQTTDTAIQMTLNIASRGGEPPRQSVVYGQDIFSIYSNYAYMCDVEMMGCAPISPMMYFQLNNIPMFKGAYLIYNVEHNIVAGNMTTKFKGNRVSKNTIPFAKADVIYLDENGKSSYGGYTEGSNVKDSSYKEKPLIPYKHNSTEDEKIKIGNAFDSAFNCASETVSMCARYVYRIAYAYKNGNLPCSLTPGAHANDEGFYKKLINLEYIEQGNLLFNSAAECRTFIKSQKWNYGDVVCYIADFISKDDGEVYSKTSPKESLMPNSVLYGHTQIYIGDARIGSTGSYGWASSLKNNYGLPFVYSDDAKFTNEENQKIVVGKHCNWRVRVFRANKNEIS